jgi:hypothetical protein
MENTRLPISAIICFNSGSAGDLLLALCLSQIGYPSDHYIDNNGAVNFNPHTQYFKAITQDIFYGTSTKENIDFARVKKIENTHYYLDWYPSVCDHLYYIDYPENLQYKILESVKKKRYNDSWSNFLEDNKTFLPKFAQEKVTEKDIVNVFVQRWNKNLVGWRSNPLITPVSFLDFFEIKKIVKLIETINKQPCQDVEILEKIHTQWLENNQDLIPK